MSGRIALAENEIDVDETDAFATVSIRRTGDTSKAVTVTYEVVGDSATAGRDFTPISGEVVIPVGAVSASIQVPILNDGASEETEVFVVALLSIDSGTLTAPRTTRVNIFDDENPVDPTPELPLVSDYVVREEAVITSASIPVDIDFAPGRSDLMFVAQQNGLVRLYNIETGARSVFVDLRDETNHNNGGLMNVEVHPNFPEDPYIYLYYSVDPPETANETGNAGMEGGGNRFNWLVRIEADPATDFTTAIPGSKTILVGGAGQSLDDISGRGELDFSVGDEYRDEPGSDQINLSEEEIALGLEYRQDLIKGDSPHIGGGIAFGPDGMLYVAIGDGVAYNYADPRTFGVQSLESLNGKVLRIDPLTGKGLADNPFVEQGASLDLNQSKVYQLGLRNPFGIGFTNDGRLVISDTGQSSYEELNIGPAGANFGWPFYEGADAGASFIPPNFRPTAENGFQQQWDEFLAENPIITYPFRGFAHGNRDPGFQFQAITGGDVDYDGGRYPEELNGHFFFSDFSDGEVYAIDLDDRSDVKFLYDRDGMAPQWLTQGPDGYVWYVNVSTQEIGRLIIERADAPEPANGVALRGTRGDDGLRGGDGDDRLSGLGGDDMLIGFRGDDRLFGGAGDDVLNGGLGHDQMKGGPGADVFVFSGLGHSVRGVARDIIRDFDRGEDKIDLSAIDANATLAGNQRFSFIGDDRFDGTAGLLRYNGKFLEADVDGDREMDFQLKLLDVPNLSGSDIIL